MRVNRLFPYGALMEGQLKGMYFQSDYAKEADARIEERIKKIVEETKERKAEMKAEETENDNLKGFINGESE